MSATRDVIARASGVEEGRCACRFCNHHSTYINDMMWCLAWDCAVRADSFCSFLSPQTDNSDRCVCCGAVVPEGRMVCPVCERRANND